MTTARTRCHHEPVADENEPKAILTAEISRSAHDGWHAFAGRRNLDLTNLAEVIGLALGGLASVSAADLPEPLRTWASDAADLQSQKRLDARMRRRKT